MKMALRPRHGVENLQAPARQMLLEQGPQVLPQALGVLVALHDEGHHVGVGEGDFLHQLGQDDFPALQSGGPQLHLERSAGGGLHLLAEFLQVLSVEGVGPIASGDLPVRGGGVCARLMHGRPADDQGLSTFHEGRPPEDPVVAV
jgi:hypothetical protein